MAGSNRKKKRDKKCKPRGTNSGGVHGGGGKTNLTTVQKALMGGGVIRSYMDKKGRPQ